MATLKTFIVKTGILILALLPACGLIMMALAAREGRADQPVAQVFYWASLALIMLPGAFLILQPRIGDGSRVAMLIYTGLSLYLIKVLQYPIYFTYFDEFLHQRSAQEILTTHHLFGTNSLLPISPMYPGLELIVTPFSQLSGLGIFPSAILVLGVVRIFLVLGVYHVALRLTGAPWMAGLATLIYLANPNSIMFDSQFSYETLAIPLAIFALYLLSRIPPAGAWQRATLILLSLVAIFTVIVTHHVTSFILCAFLLFWAIVAFIRHDRRTGTQLILLGTATLGMIVTWILVVARIVLAYLNPYITGSLREFVHLVQRDGTTRQLFVDTSGYVAPTWERFSATSASVLLVVLIIPALYVMWRYYRFDPFSLAMGLAGLVYPFSLVLRLTQSGADAAGRLSGFVFLPLGFLFACLYYRFRLSDVLATISWRVRWQVPRLTPRVYASPALQGLTLITLGFIFLGSVIAGNGPVWARLPGPYIVAADMRSVDPISIATSQWVKNHLSPDARVAADRINGALIGADTSAHIVTLINDSVDVAPIYYAPSVTGDTVYRMQVGNIEYLVVDNRLTTGLPKYGTYFEGGNPYLGPLGLSIGQLQKFDTDPTLFNRIFDNGTISIYRIRISQ